MKKVPQIFTSLQRQDAPVPADILSDLESEGTMPNIMENWREYISILLAENKLSQSELKALQAVKDGQTSEPDGRKASTFSKLIRAGLIDGIIDQGSSPRKTRRGFMATRYRTVSNMKVTPTGESALVAGAQRVAGEGDKFKKIIMQAIIDANGQPVPELMSCEVGEVP